MIKIGLYFGSFNPVHRAHLSIAQNALNHLDEVHFVVSPANPDKEATGELEDAEHRLKMTEIAADFLNQYAGLNLQVSDVEFHLPRPSWTDASIAKIKENIETERGLKEDEYELHIICGRDTHHRIQTWENFDYILENCHFLVYDRAGADRVENEALDAKSFYVKDLGVIPVSSTLLREKINKGGEVYDLTLDVVDYYIRNNNLYRRKK